MNARRDVRLESSRRRRVKRRRRADGWPFEERRGASSRLAESFLGGSTAGELLSSLLALAPPPGGSLQQPRMMNSRHSTAPATSHLTSDKASNPAPTFNSRARPSAVPPHATTSPRARARVAASLVTAASLLAPPHARARARSRGPPPSRRHPAGWRVLHAPLVRRRSPSPIDPWASGAARPASSLAPPPPPRPRRPSFPAGPRLRQPTRCCSSLRRPRALPCSRSTARTSSRRSTTCTASLSRSTRRRR